MNKDSKAETIKVVGIDLAKSVFHLHGLSEMMAYKAVSCISTSLTGSGASKGRRLDEAGNVQ